MGVYEDKKNKALDVELMSEFFQHLPEKAKYSKACLYSAEINGCHSRTMRRAHDEFPDGARELITKSKGNDGLENRRVEFKNFLKKSGAISQSIPNEMWWAIDVELIKRLFPSELKSWRKNELACFFAARVNGKQVKTMRRAHEAFEKEAIGLIRQTTREDDDLIQIRMERCKGFIRNYYRGS